MAPLHITVFRPPVLVLHKFSKPVECLALGYLTAALRLDGHTVRMLDGMLYKWTVKQSVKAILKTETKILCITNVVQYFPEETIQIISQLRASGFEGIILAGGHSLSFFPERILQLVKGLDAVIVGEGEEAIREIAAAVSRGEDWKKCNSVAFLQEGVFTRNPVNRIKDLDSLPYPARDLTREIIHNDGLVCVSTSRGCYARCTFCSVPRFYGLESGKLHGSGDWRPRSVESIIGEVKSLSQEFHLRELLIVDDEFFGGSELGLKRALEFGKAMENLALPLKFTISCRAENVHEEVFLQLKKGGLTHVFVGLETGNQEELKLYAKGHSVEQNRRAVQIIKSLGLTFQPGFMMINHRSTLQTIKQNIAFLEELGECKPVTINSIVDPHFGAPLTDLMAREGAVLDKGLMLEAQIQDPGVLLMMKVIANCAKAFEPFMNVIAAFHSSVTYEWRREIPGRSEETRQLLDAFEDFVNRGFVSVVKEMLDEMEPGGYTPERILKLTASKIRKIKQQLSVFVPQVVECVTSKEGDLRYYSQQELIN